MGQFEEETIDPLELESVSPSRPVRPSRPVVFSRREDEERTTFMPQKRPSPSYPPSSRRDGVSSTGSSTGPSRNGQRTAKTSSNRPPRPSLPPVVADDATMIKPFAAPRPGWSKTMPPPSAKPSTLSPSPPPSTSLAPRARPPLPPPAPSVIIPDEQPSLPAVSRDVEATVAATQTTMPVAPRARPQRWKQPLFMVAGGLATLAALFAFGLIVGLASLVRTSPGASAAAMGPVPVMPAVAAPRLAAIAAAADPSAPVVAAPIAPAPNAPNAMDVADYTPPAPAPAAPKPAPVRVARVAVRTPSPTPPAPPIAMVAAAVSPRALSAATTPRVAPAPVAKPAAAAAANDASLPPVTKGHRGKASESDLDDAKAAAELARAQLEASLR